MNVLWRDMCVTTMIIKLCERKKKKKNKPNKFNLRDIS